MYGFTECETRGGTVSKRRKHLPPFQYSVLSRMSVSFLVHFAFVHYTFVPYVWRERSLPSNTTAVTFWRVLPTHRNHVAPELLHHPYISPSSDNSQHHGHTLLNGRYYPPIAHPIPVPSLPPSSTCPPPVHELNFSPTSPKPGAASDFR